jgi:uncharacterized protein YyaL (SSP411 family)
MPSILLRPTLVSLTFLVISCGDPEKKNAKENRFNTDDFFNGAESTVSLDSFENELSDSSTDFLRSFGDDSIKWQKWDASLLEKARSAQSPIMALVGTSLGGSSRAVAKELAETPRLKKLITSQAICTVVDTHVYPEVAALSYYLSGEIQRSTAFPMMIWLSHEGSPLAWYPIGELSGRELDVIVSNAVAMVDDTWLRFSGYAVENSRSDNEARQRRFDAGLDGPREGVEIERRDEVFRSSTRQLSSLYSFGDKDLDNVGGLIPSNSLELLATGSRSRLLTEEVRANCLKAAKEVTQELIDGAIKDHLDGSYFMARRTTDWSLPSFSKSLSTQLKVSHMLIRVGTILENERFIQEGLDLLAMLERDWINKPLSSRSPLGDQDEPGKFFWDLKTLKKILAEDEFPLSLAAFSLKEEGNIPSAVDPLDNFYERNTLRRRISLTELAKQYGSSEKQVEVKLNTIEQKLLKYREENTQFESETTLSVIDLALVLKVQLARASHLRTAPHLTAAIATAERILYDFFDLKKGFSRLEIKNSFVAARCGDYATTSNAFLLLYQATLEEKWLDTALKILDEGITKLNSDSGLLMESAEQDRVIPLRQHSRTMILGDSSLGALDLVLTRAFAITGDEKYGTMLEAQRKCLAPLTKVSPVNHTDFIASCALGEKPLLAVIQGDPTSPAGQNVLAILNSQKHLPFLSVRSRRDGDFFPEYSGSAPTVFVTMVRDGKSLGIAADTSGLEVLLDRIISQK